MFSYTADHPLSNATGAATGTGEGIARILGRHGAYVMLWGISEKVFETSSSLKKKGYKATPYRVAVTSKEEIQNTVREIIAAHGKIDILCNNAGIIRPVNFLEISDKTRDLHFDIHVKGV